MSWWLTAKPGDKVVCVNRPSDRACEIMSLVIPEGHPRLGEVVTVVEVFPCEGGFGFSASNYPLRKVAEVTVCLFCEDFRPAVDKSTDRQVEALKRIADEMNERA